MNALQRIPHFGFELNPPTRSKPVRNPEDPMPTSLAPQPHNPKETTPLGDKQNATFSGCCWISNLDIVRQSTENAASEDRTHDLRIMRPARYQLRYRRYGNSPTQMSAASLEGFLVETTKEISPETFQLSSQHCWTSPKKAMTERTMQPAHRENAPWEARAPDLEVNSLTL
jgi:hypothetical protein